MASMSKTKTGSYRVQWYEGKKKCQRTFAKRDEAKTFAAELELAPETRRSKILVRELLRQYRETETPKKGGAREESLRIGRLMKRPLASLTVSQISTRDIDQYIRTRSEEPSKKHPKQKVSSSTVKKEVMTLSAIFTDAVKKGLMEVNPCKEAGKIEPKDARERTASPQDIERLMIASGWDGVSVPASETELVVLAFVFACQTGMRSGEILEMEEAWISDRVVHLPEDATKTRKARNVALSSEALRLLNLARQRGSSPRIFGELTDWSRDVLFRKIRDRAGLNDVCDSKGRVIQQGLTFHDSRATFATWAASPDPKTGALRLDVMALARQTGHRNLKMLMRYYRPSAEDVAKRLG